MSGIYIRIKKKNLFTGEPTSQKLLRTKYIY